MFNVGGGEVIVILLLALIVLGPTKLPEVARQVGRAMQTLRGISNTFQAEMKAAMEDPIEAAARDRGKKLVASEQKPAPDPTPEADEPVPASDPADAEGTQPNTAEPVDTDEPAATTPVDQDAGESEEPAASPAEQAGMYNQQATAAPEKPASPRPATSESPDLVRNPFRQSSPES